MNAIVLPEPSGIWADADDSVDPVAAVELSFMAGADEADCSAAGADVAAALLVAAALVAAVLVAAVLVAASPDDEHAANNSMVAADMATAARPSVKRDMNTPFGGPTALFTHAEVGSARIEIAHPSVRGQQPDCWQDQLPYRRCQQKLARLVYLPADFKI